MINEQQRFEYTQYVLDVTREYLHTPQVSRRLGALAAGMREVSMNARAVPVVNGEVQEIAGYADTELVPVVGLAYNETATYTMLAQTPLQYQNSLQQDPTKRVPWAQGVVEDLHLPNYAGAITSAPTVMSTYWQYENGVRSLQVRYDRSRPLVALACDDSGLARAVLRLAHEFEHVSEYIDTPVATGYSADRSLTTELRAYGKQSRIMRGILNPEAPMYKTATRIEALRHEYNGPLHVDGAFWPNPALKNRLADDAFNFWYYHD